MSKVEEIHYFNEYRDCSVCPYRKNAERGRGHKKEFFCVHSRIKKDHLVTPKTGEIVSTSLIIPNYPEFPLWCPLPNKESKEEKN